MNKLGLAAAEPARKPTRLAANRYPRPRSQATRGSYAGLLTIRVSANRSRNGVAAHSALLVTCASPVVPWSAIRVRVGVAESHPGLAAQLVDGSFAPVLNIEMDATGIETLRNRRRYLLNIGVDSPMKILNSWPIRHVLPV